MGETESWREVLEVIEVVKTMEFQALLLVISTSRGVLWLVERR